ncbi:NAD-dependent epimerase/dehydratase family protein [archaeon]|nr:MAG: NAD-dependent epimerase/dehydratase family protein [archaeon]
MKILITGGNGFIGSHFADRLIKNGDDVTLFDLEYTGNTGHMKCEKITGDITNMKNISDAVKGKDFIFHFAAVSRVVWGQQDPVKCINTNIIGTSNVLESVRNLNKNATVFLASSKEVYGNAQKMPVNETHPKNPISVYAASKLAAERFCIAYQKTFGINCVITRFSSVYGSERDRLGRVVPTFMLNALKGKPLNISTSGHMLDFTFIDDVVQGMFKTYKACGKKDISGEDFHFATGKGTSLEELAGTVLKICNSKSDVTVNDVSDYYSEGFVADLTKAKSLVGYEPKYKLCDGLKLLKTRLEENCL